MASERNDDDIDFDYWDNLIKETEDIDELKSFKGQNSIIDGLIDEELVSRGELALDADSEDPFAPLFQGIQMNHYVLIWVIVFRY